MLVAAGAIELVAGILLTLGLFTRITAFIASGELAFAYFIVHFPKGFWPIREQRRGGDPLLLHLALHRGRRTGRMEPRRSTGEPR